MDKKVLVVVTNFNHYEKTKEPTGLWLSEFVHFYDLLAKEGYEMEIASVLGGKTPLDPASISAQMLDPITQKYYEQSDFMEKLNHTKVLKDLKSSDYHTIYFTGGHGTMWDFPESKDIASISKEIYENDGIVSAVCHGVGALLPIQLSDGSYLIDGKEVTGYSTKEEEIGKALDKIPFQLEEALKEKHAKYKKALLPFTSCVKVDGRLITGQNPQSTSDVAKAVLKKLKENNK